MLELELQYTTTHKESNHQLGMLQCGYYLDPCGGPTHLNALDIKMKLPEPLTQQHGDISSPASYFCI
jgi:hypothetical protein